MGSRSIGPRTTFDENAAGLRFSRRESLLLGASAAVGTACSVGVDDEPSEPIGTSEQAFTFVPQADVNFSSVPSWTYSRIVSFFNWVRDVRWLEDQVNGWLLRRISWLYPDAGCEARSELVVQYASMNFLTKPYKLFVLGDLRPTTDNHPSGSVRWGSHVAPVVRSSATGTAYLLDPALYSAGPLSWSSWRSRLNPGAFPVSYAVMDPSWYNPLGPHKADKAYAIDELEYEYLPLEWDRQIELGRDPRQVLGDNPPW